MDEKEKLERFKHNYIFTIHKISHMIKQYNNKDLEEYGLTNQQARIIGYLWFNKDNDINQKMIEQEIGIKGSSVTSLIQNLEKQGFITRIKDKNDGRNNVLILTEKGIGLHEILFDKINKLQMKLLQGIDEEQRISFLNALTKVLENIEE